MIRQKNKPSTSTEPIFISQLVHQLKRAFLLLLLCNISFMGWGGCSSNSPDEDIKKEEPGETPDNKDVSIIVTTTNRSMDLHRTGVSFSDKSNMSPSTITIDPSEKFQEMDGFGAAVTGSTCFNLLRMDKEDRYKFLKETFDPKDGLGYSYIRISIGCSDFSLSEYTCCDEEASKILPFKAKKRIMLSQY